MVTRVQFKKAYSCRPWLWYQSQVVLTTGLHHFHFHLLPPPPRLKAVAPRHNLESNILNPVDGLDTNHSDAYRSGHGHAIALSHPGLPVGRRDHHLGDAAGRDGNVVLKRCRFI